MRTHTTALGLIGLVSLPLLATDAQASPSSANRVNNTQAKLLECVTLNGVREHQAALEAIADASIAFRWNAFTTAGAASAPASPRPARRRIRNGTAPPPV